jgi:hypothetical protein
MRVVEEEYVR